MSNLGSAFVQIVPSAEGITGSIANVLGAEADSAGKATGSRLVDTIKGVIVAAGIGKALMASINEGAALQQSLGGIETLYKGSADRMKQYANDAFVTTGLSANAYMENVTGFSASLLSSLKGDTEAAAEAANTAMIDMADNSNKMGTSMESIQMAYQGFAKQNYTMLDNLKLGYGGTKTEMERLLKDAQKITGVKYDINNLADVYSAIHVIQSELDITGTTAKEASTTFTGSFAAMKAAALNVIGGLSLGQDITPALEGLASTVATFLFGNFIPMLTNVLTGLPSMVVTFLKTAGPIFIENGAKLVTNLIEGIATGYPEFIAGFAELLENIPPVIESNFPALIENGVALISNFANGIIQKIPDLLNDFNYILIDIFAIITDYLPIMLEGGADILLNILQGLVDNLPQLVEGFNTLIDSTVMFLKDNLPKFLEKGVEIILKLANGILKNLPTILGAIGSIIGHLIKAIVENLPQLLALGFQLIGKLAKGLLEALPNVLSAMASLVSSIWDSVSGIDLWSAGSAIINGFLGGLKSAFEGVKNFVGGIASWIANHKGPLSYDRRLLIPAGNAIMQGLNSGLKTSFEDVKSTVSDMGGSISEMMNGSLGNSIQSDFLMNARVNGNQLGAIASQNNMGAQLGGVTININGYNRDEKELAERIKDELLNEERRKEMAFNG